MSKHKSGSTIIIFVIISSSLFSQAKEAIADVYFSTPTYYNVGSLNPSAWLLAAGDFNNDKHLDLATSSPEDDSVRILLGNGRGEFTFTSTIESGRNPRGMAVADVNNDGKIDVITANATGIGYISVYLGNGNGTLQTRMDFDVCDREGCDPHNIDLDDYNGDGNLDVAVSPYFYNSVILMKGDGKGNFMVDTRFGGAGGFYGVLFNDFNGDNRKDIVSSAGLALKEVDNQFQPPLITDATGYEWVAGSSDFNKDGIADLVVPRVDGPHRDEVAIYMGNKSANLTASAYYATGPIGSRPTKTAMADFDLDGNEDIAVINRNAKTVSFFLGAGDGTFQPKVDFSAPSTAEDITKGDFNEDGLTDIAYIHYPHSVGILLNSSLLAAILPTARSVQVGQAATAFGTIINNTGIDATSCYLSLPDNPSIPAYFNYQTTNASNQLVGSPNTPVDIPSGGSQGFVFSITPTATFNATDIPIAFDCGNTAPAPSQMGLNTFLLSASSMPVPDMIAIGATASGDGVLRIPEPTGVHAFGTAAVNIGASDTITATADTGGISLPLTLTLCQTNPNTGGCLTAPTASVSSTIGNQQVATYSVFAQASSAIAFDPTVNRIFLRLSSGGVVRGATSVAVMTEDAAN